MLHVRSGVHCALGTLALALHCHRLVHWCHVLHPRWTLTLPRHPSTACSTSIKSDPRSFLEIKPLKSIVGAVSMA